MGVLTLSRRRFLEASAVAGGAAVLSAATASSALAESNVESGGSNDVKRVRSCCRACGKMECGVWVTVQNGRAIRVEGDESAFQSMGNCCNKSQSSIQAAYHPDRLYHPMKRTNPKDNDDPGWVRISWEEAFSMTIGDAIVHIGIEGADEEALAEAISHELPRPKTPKEVLEELERERAEREAAAAKEE